jgi:hypothetical protein
MLGFKLPLRPRGVVAVHTSLLFLAAVVSAAALAQDQDDVVVTTHHIDAVRGPRTPWDEVQNCLKDTACAAAVNVIAAQIGIPSNAVRLVNAAAAYTAKAEGEETRYAMPAVAGRKICAVKIRTTSVVPAEGDRASFFSINATPEQVGIYTWTPRQGIGAGRSWYEGDVFIVHVKESLRDTYVQAGKCTVSPTSAATYQCRGAKGVNHGLAACGSKDL